MTTEHVQDSERIQAFQARCSSSWRNHNWLWNWTQPKSVRQMLLVLQFMKFLRQGDLFSAVREETGKMKEEHLVQNILYPFLSSLQYLHSKARHLGLGTIISVSHFRESFIGTSSLKTSLWHKIIQSRLPVLLMLDLKAYWDWCGMDFGLSIDENKERPVTRAGTLDYMAPEVLHCPNKTFPEDNKLNKSLVYN